MNWYDRLLRRTPQSVIPNPRDNKRKQDRYDMVLIGVLRTAQFLCFALAFLILVEVTQ